MKLPNPIAITTIAVLTASVLLAQSRMRPGQYEMTSDMSSAGKAMPAIEASECVTAEVLKDQTRLLMSAADDQNCKVSDLVKAGDRMTFTFTCKEDGVEFVSRAEMNYGVDAYSAVVTTMTEGQVITTKMSAKRVGDCK